MVNKENILEGHTDLEKGAYLGAIASLATADRKASEEEMKYIQNLCDAAQLSVQQKEMVVRAATEMSGEELKKCLNVLKTSDLKYSLITDLIAFGKSDSEYSMDEEKSVQKIASHLGVGEKQFSLLDQFADKITTSEAAPEEKTKPTFFSSLGFNEKIQNAGINPGTLFNGLLGIAGPMILAGILQGNRRKTGIGSGGLGGSSLGGGGLGSLIGMLSGGRGIGGTGGLLGRILGGRS